MKRLKKDFLGEEPVFVEPITDPNDIRLAEIYSWYNYHYKIADGKEWIKTYMKGRYLPEETEAFYKSPDPLTPFYIGVHARLHNRGMEIPRYKLDHHIQKVLDQEKLVVTPEQDTLVVEPTVQSYIRKKIGETIGIIENLIDEFYRKDYKFFEPHVYVLLQQRDVKAAQARVIYNYYLPLMREAVDVYKGNIQEGYERLTNSHKKNAVLFIGEICEDLKRFSANEQQSRKPRKRKEKSSIQLTTKVQYAKACQELKLVSIDPFNIIGASSLWVYNLKYRKLSRLVSSSPKGLNVKGTSVINIDEKESECRTLRWPEETLKAVLEQGKVGLKSILKNLTTKPTTLTGRLGKDTIILRAIK